MNMQELARAATTWLAEDPDPDTRQELEAILEGGDHQALAERFGTSLEFGTAGLRGLIGAGPNRFNRSVVIRTTAGLAAHLLARVPDAKERGVVVGYDGRHVSAEAARDVAAVLAGHGIRALVFSQVAPTPLTAFAIQHHRAAAGAMITASHNPAKYNGYKVYWGNGAQVIPPHDSGIADAISKLGGLAAIPRLEEEEARSAGLFVDLGEDTIRAYLAAVQSLSLVPASDRSARAPLPIAYTPLHGVGGSLAKRTLTAFGFDAVHVVPEQLEPDPDFPTVEFPNPEEEGAMERVLALGAKAGAKLVLANDPDADRLAVALPSPDGSFLQLSGNEIGVLLAEHLLEHDPKKGDRLLLTTIVSTPMAGAIARAHGARYEEVLTGFKWIANRAMALEEQTGTRFVLGFEEALGYSVGAVCRDKDGLSAAAVFAELAGFAAAEGETVLDKLEGLYRRHGLYLSRQAGFTAPGAQGLARIQATMERLRSAPPAVIDGRKVVARRDYLDGTMHLQGGGVERLDLPSSNVLAFDLEGGSRVIARPSGTEPKIKYYFDLREPVADLEPLDATRRRAEEAIESLAGAFVRLVEGT